MTNQNQPGQQNQSPGQKPGQQGGGQTPGQQSQAKHGVARDLNRQGGRRARRSDEEGQQAEPYETEGAGHRVDRAQHAFSIGRGVVAARQPSG